MTELEKEVEQKLRRMIEKHGGLCLKWVCPGWAGVPDRIILMPGGRVLFVETKRPKGGRLEKLQAWWISRLRDLGFYAFRVNDPAGINALELVLQDIRERR